MLTALAALTAAGMPSVLAQCESAKLLASDGVLGDRFGSSVAISGDIAVIGAFVDETPRWATGSGYVFRFDGSRWVEEQKLLASDGEHNDEFGRAVAISGFTILIGAPGEDDNGQRSGAAYVFRFDGAEWVQQAKLLPSDGDAEDLFGHSVDISGDTAVVGAPVDEDNGIRAGSAYVFRYDGSSWVEEAKFTAYDGGRFVEFGGAVSIANNTVVIGATGAGKSGSAYVFRRERGKWIQDAELIPSDGADDDRFGTSVAISGNSVVIRATGAGKSGSAYVFRFDGSTWKEEGKLLASDGAKGDFFGWTVGIFGDTVLVGAHRNTFASEPAYVFRFDGSHWFQHSKLLASGRSNSDGFGKPVAIWGQTAVIGAQSDDERGLRSGSAYVFDLGGESCAGRERLAVRCKPRLHRPGNRLIAKVKRGVPTKTLTLRLDGDPDRDELINLNCNARGKVRFLNVPSGRHAVEIVDCGVKGNVDCP